MDTIQDIHKGTLLSENGNTTWRVDTEPIVNDTGNVSFEMTVHDAIGDSPWYDRIGESYGMGWHLRPQDLEETGMWTIVGDLSTGWRTVECSNGCGKFVLTPDDVWRSTCGECS